MSNFKVGDKVVCISKGDNAYISVGGEYTVTSVGFDTVEIINDFGDNHKCFYKNYFFKKKEEKKEVQMTENLKIGGKVVCVNRGDYLSLTVGKEYIVLHVDELLGTLILNDIGNREWYYTNRFKKVEEKVDKVSRMIETTVTKNIKNTILAGYIRIKPNATGGSINLYYDNNHPYTSLAWLTKPELKKMIEDLQEVYEVLDEWE